MFPHRIRAIWCGTAIAEIAWSQPRSGCVLEKAVEYATYADATRRARTIHGSGRCARPCSRQRSRRRGRHQSITGGSRALDHSDSAIDLLDRQGRADRPRLVEVRSSPVARQAGTLGRECRAEEAGARTRAPADVADAT